MPTYDRIPGHAQPDYLKKIAYNVFELGHGYKTRATVLDVSVYTVREWYAQYKLGHYDADFMESKPKRKSYWNLLKIGTVFRNEWDSKLLRGGTL